MKSILRSVLTDTNKGVIIVNSDCVIELVTERAIEYLGLSSETEGTELQKIELGQLFDDILQGKGSMHSLDSYENRKYNLFFENDGTYIKPKNMDVMYKISSVTAEENAAIIIEKETTANFQKVLQLNSDLIAYIYSDDNVELKYTKTNPESSQDLLNKIHHKDVKYVKEAIKQIFSGETDKLKISARIKIQKKWRVYKLTMHSESLLPNITNSIILGTDITNKYLSEQRRLVINRILRHDVRNEMNVIKGYADVIRQHDEINDEINEYADIVHKKSSDLIKLSNEVREVDKELYRVKRKIRKVNLNTMVHKTVKELQQEYPNVQFRMTLSDEYNKVIGNTFIKTAIKHIIENGIIHNDSDQKEITIKSEHNNKRLNLIVEDNGPGIDMNIKKIIQTGIETPLEHSTGLGLWLVKWISELVDAKLEITIPQNKTGTRVIIKFHDIHSDIEKIRNKNKKIRADLESLPGLTDDENDLRTTTRE